MEHPWTPKLAEFYNFIEGSRKFIEMNPRQCADKHLIHEIRKTIEISKKSPNGTIYKEPKFDSAIYQDIDHIASLRAFLQRFTLDDLKCFQKLIYIEIQGLENDLKPQNIIASTLPAAIITGGSLIVAWSAFWSVIYFDFDTVEVFIKVFKEKIQNISWLNGILSLIFVIGGFIGISSYVTASHRNLNQILYLRSLYRTMELYLLLEEVGSQIVLA